MIWMCFAGLSVVVAFAAFAWWLTDGFTDFI